MECWDLTRWAETHAFEDLADECPGSEVRVTFTLMHVTLIARCIERGAHCQENPFSCYGAIVEVAPCESAKDGLSE